MAARDKILLDTDVALDHLPDRQPFAEYAHRLLALAEKGELIICVSSLSGYCHLSIPPEPAEQPNAKILGANDFKCAERHEVHELTREWRKGEDSNLR